MKATPYRVFADPGAIYQCDSEVKVLKEFTYGRYEVVKAIEAKYDEDEEAITQ